MPYPFNPAPLRAGQVQNTFKHLQFGVNFFLAEALLAPILVAPLTAKTFLKKSFMPKTITYAQTAMRQTNEKYEYLNAGPHPAKVSYDKCGPVLNDYCDDDSVKTRNI